MYSLSGTCLNSNIVFVLFYITNQEYTVSVSLLLSDWAHEYVWEICAEHKMHIQGVSTVNVNKTCVSVINDHYSIPINIEKRAFNH